VAFIASRHALLSDAVLLTTRVALFLLVLLPLFFRHGLLQLLAVLCHLRRRHSAWITLYTTSDFLLIALRGRPPFGRGIAFRVIFLGACGLEGGGFNVVGLRIFILGNGGAI